MTNELTAIPQPTPAPTIEADGYEVPDEAAVKKALEDRFGEAEKLLSDPDNLEKTLQKLEKKLVESSPIPKVGEILSNVPVLISLVRSYAKKEYDVIPLASVIAIVAAIIYCASTLDLIPDFIPIAGIVDDAAVLYFALNMVEADVEEYKNWREANGKTV